MVQAEREFYTRFLRRQSHSSDMPSSIYRAAGPSKDAKEWQKKMQIWEQAILESHILVSHEDAAVNENLQG